MIFRHVNFKIVAKYYFCLLNCLPPIWCFYIEADAESAIFSINFGFLRKAPFWLSDKTTELTQQYEIPRQKGENNKIQKYLRYLFNWSNMIEQKTGQIWSSWQIWDEILDKYEMKGWQIQDGTAVRRLITCGSIERWPREEYQTETHSIPRAAFCCFSIFQHFLPPEIPPSPSETEENIYHYFLDVAAHIFRVLYW